MQSEDQGDGALGRIFLKYDRQDAKKKNSVLDDILRKSTITQEHYPMYAIPVPVLLKLTEILPHQDMLKMGQLVRVTPLHAGKIIFVSPLGDDDDCDCGA